MGIRLPPLSGLRLFEAAARCGSFKRAAQELGLTPGAFSHGIDSLEEWLDVQLFERKAGGVVLTEAGRQYLPYISQALSMIATGTLRLPSRRFEERLSISSADLFAAKVLLPRLHKFRDMHPNMLITVDVSREVIHLPSDQFDVAIRSAREGRSDLACELLGRLSFVPVGEPSYVKNLLRENALDWSRATLVHDTNVAEDWESWCNQTQTDISSARKLVVSTGRFALQAATDGLGLAIGRLPLIDDDLAAGRLAIAVNQVVPVRLGYWLVTPPGTETRPEIVAFRNWLLEEMTLLKWSARAASALVQSADQSEREQALSAQPDLSTEMSNSTDS